MNVIALTVVVGLVLVTLFALLYVVQILNHPPGGGAAASLPIMEVEGAALKSAPELAG